MKKIIAIQTPRLMSDDVVDSWWRQVFPGAFTKNGGPVIVRNLPLPPQPMSGIYSDFQRKGTEEPEAFIVCAPFRSGTASRPPHARYNSLGTIAHASPSFTSTPRTSAPRAFHLSTANLHLSPPQSAASGRKTTDVDSHEPTTVTNNYLDGSKVQYELKGLSIVYNDQQWALFKETGMWKIRVLVTEPGLQTSIDASFVRLFLRTNEASIQSAFYMRQSEITHQLAWNQGGEIKLCRDAILRLIGEDEACQCSCFTSSRTPINVETLVDFYKSYIDDHCAHWVNISSENRRPFETELVKFVQSALDPKKTGEPDSKAIKAVLEQVLGELTHLGQTQGISGGRQFLE